MDLRLYSYEQDDDTDEGGEILENDDEIKRKALEEKRKQKRNCKIYQVGDILHYPEQNIMDIHSCRNWLPLWWVWSQILITCEPKFKISEGGGMISRQAI